MIRQNKTKRIILTTVAAVFALAILVTPFTVKAASIDFSGSSFRIAPYKTDYTFSDKSTSIAIQVPAVTWLRPDGTNMQVGDLDSKGLNWTLKAFSNAFAQTSEIQDCINQVGTVEKTNLVAGRFGGACSFNLHTQPNGNNTSTVTVISLDVSTSSYLRDMVAAKKTVVLQMVPTLIVDQTATPGDLVVFQPNVVGNSINLNWSSDPSLPTQYIPGTTNSTDYFSKVIPPNSRTGGTGGTLSDGGQGNPLEQALMTVVNIILVLIFTVVKTLILIINTLIIKPLLNWLLSSGGSNFWMASNIPNFVNIGWTMIRDLVNSLFVFVLIYSAVRLMLNKSNYGLRQIIVKVVVAAVVVNISLIAGQLVLQMAQVLIRTFVDPNALNVISQGMILGPNASFTGIWSQLFNGVSGTANLVIGILYDIAVVFVLGAFALILVYRLAMLWLMLILAPIPYVVELFQLKSVPEEARPFMSVSGWWGNFINLAFLAPVMAFMISLATFFATTGKTAITAGIDQLGLTDQGGVVHETLATVIYGMFTLTILYLSLKIAKSMSKGLGDKFVEKISDNAQKWSKATGKSSFVFGSRIIGSKLEGTKIPVLKQYGTLIKKAPLAPGIAAGVAKNISSRAQTKLKAEQEADVGTIETGLAKSRGIGRAARYLGADTERKKSALESKAGTFKSDLLAEPEAKQPDIWGDKVLHSSNLAERRAAFDLMVDKDKFPADIVKARQIMTSATKELAINPKDILKNYPHLAADDPTVIRNLQGLDENDLLGFKKSAYANRTVLNFVKATFRRKYQAMISAAITSPPGAPVTYDQGQLNKIRDIARSNPGRNQTGKMVQRDQAQVILRANGLRW